MSYQDPSYDPYQQQPDPYQQQQPHPPQQQQQPGYQYPQQPYSAQPYSPYPQPGAYPGYGPPPVAPSGQTNTMAILSLVFAFVFWPLAIVFGHMARKQIRERNEEGGGLATAGLVLGYVFGAISLVVCAFYIVAIIFLANHSSATTGY